MNETTAPTTTGPVVNNLLTDDENAIMPDAYGYLRAYVSRLRSYDALEPGAFWNDMLGQLTLLACKWHNGVDVTAISPPNGRC